jgi:hypothetical protein
MRLENILRHTKIIIIKLKEWLKSETKLEKAQGDNNKLYERLNEQLSSEVNFLRYELREERKINSLLLRRLGVREQTKVEIENFEPIGGYEKLKDKIKNAEIKSRKELERIESSKNAT